MSDAPSKQGPELTQNILEARGHFPSDAAMQEALGGLTLAGFDRAEFSLPEEQAGQSVQTPNEGAENPTDNIDQTQLRTMGTGMAGYAGAVAAAGITLATGGAAAVAIAAAAAVGAGGALTANAMGNAADNASKADRDARGAAGTLILAVRLRSPDQFDTVREIMTKAGATSIEPITRGDDLLTAGVSSASWTGG